MRDQIYTYSYDANRLDLIETTYDGNINQNAYDYDEAGNLIGRGTNSPKVYSYGDNNRMIMISKNNRALAQYRYNGKGERSIRYKYDDDACSGVEEEACTDPATIDESFIARTFIYHYGQQGQLLGETIFDQGNQRSRTREYIWLDQRPVAYIDTRYKSSDGSVKNRFQNSIQPPFPFPGFG